MKKTNYIGMTFGSWKVIDYDTQKCQETKNTYYVCQCSCGQIKSVYGMSLKNGKSTQCKSCSLTKYPDQNMIGMRFGNLTIIKLEKREKGNSYWLCKCDCGNNKIVLGRSLFHGNTRSCGCLQKETASEIFSTHKMSNKRIYHTWENMISRCYYTKDMSYRAYGGRGITVCDEWKSSFETFYNWAVSHGYSDTLTIDRINVNGNYEPNNCRWVDMISQANNRRTNRYFMINGENLTISQIARKFNLNPNTLRTKIRNGATKKEIEEMCNLLEESH